MKKLLLIAFVFIGLSASAQNYNDSTITLQLTQRAALYIGFYVKNTFQWSERLAPAILKPYIGSGQNQDSLFNVTVRASYIKGMVDLLLGSPGEIVNLDRNKIISNSPSVVGYTALATQIVNKAAGSSSEKQVAQYVLDYYNERVTAYGALNTENKTTIVTWSRQ